jgi:hypothetical protein
MKRTGLMDALTAAKPTAGKGETPAAKRSKRTNPDYTQICMLVPKDTYFEVRRRLIGTEMDASDLVGSLLTEWLDRVPSGKKRSA